MNVSVVICTFTMDQYADVCDAADSVLNQTHDQTELILISDGAPTVFQAMKRDYGDCADTVMRMTEENCGVSQSRNLGAELSHSRIIGFIDHNAVTEPSWVEKLLKGYEEFDALAVGGQMIPQWVTGKPPFLPEEYYWLIGVTHRGYPDEATRVRNTWGSNFSVRRNVFEELGEFDETLGRIADKQVQDEEPEFGARLYNRYGERMLYFPSAKVAHKIFEYRTDRWWLLNRAFWQGYSKYVMRTLLDDSGGGEDTFLQRLLIEFFLGRIKQLLNGSSRQQLDQIIMLLLFTVIVESGFIYGMCRNLIGDDFSGRRGATR